MLPEIVAGGGRRPMIASDVRDFPEPDSPTRPRTSPEAMEKLRSRTAAGASWFLADGWTVGKAMVRFRTSRSGATMGMVTVEGWRLTCFQISGSIFARKTVMRGLE